MSPIIETHFLSCLLMLGPPERRGNAFYGSEYFKRVVNWWETHVGTAGSHWYAGRYLKWWLNNCVECKPQTVVEWEAQTFAEWEALSCSRK